jgi:hypothetical protein
MMLLYTTSDGSFAQLAFLTFQREQIPVHTSDVDPATSGLGSPFMQRQHRIYLLNNEDLPRAKELLMEIGAKFDAPPSLPNPKYLTAILFVVGFALAIAVVLLQK